MREIDKRSLFEMYLCDPNALSFEPENSLVFEIWIKELMTAYDNKVKLDIIDS